MYACAVLHPKSGAVLTEHTHFTIASIAEETLYEEIAEYGHILKQPILGMVLELKPESVEILLGGLFTSECEEIPLTSRSEGIALFDKHMENYLGYVFEHKRPIDLRVASPSCQRVLDPVD